MTDRLLGGLEHVVLLAVLNLEGEDCYAVPIRKLIEERGGRTVSRGALYTVLDRLESKGYLDSSLGHSSTLRAGKPKRLYLVTPLGISALRLSRSTLADLSQGVEAILEAKQ